MIRVYLMKTDWLSEPSEYERFLTKVDGERREKISSLPREADRLRSLGAGLLLIYGLRMWEKQRSGSGEQSAHRLSFTYGPKGKPYFAQLPLYFNLSHSNEYVACAFSDTEVGLDLQYRRECDYRRVGGRFFTGEELERFSAMDGQEQKYFFYSCWTRREAFGKLTGGGLADSLGSWQEAECGRVCFAEYDGTADYQAAVCWRKEDGHQTILWRSVTECELGGII